MGRCSPYFRNLFKSNLYEYKTNTLKIPDFSADVVKHVLHFIYDGATDKFNDYIVEFVRFADKYEIKSLWDMCMSTIANSVDKDNFFKFIEMF